MALVSAWASSNEDTITMTHHHSPNGRRCSVPGCTAPARGRGPHCETHRQRKRRNGHVDQHPVTKATLRPYVARVRKIVERDQTGQLAAALHQLHDLIGARGRQIVADAASGRPGSKWERIAAQEAAQVVADTDAIGCAATLAALFLLRDEEPGHFASDEGFRFQLARAFRAQTSRAFGSYWDHESGRTKTVYRDTPPRATALLAGWLVEAYARFAAHVVAWDRAERATQAEAHAAIDAAFAAMGTTPPS